MYCNDMLDNLPVIYKYWGKKQVLKYGDYENGKNKYVRILTFCM